MICLGIESTAHTFSISIVDGAKKKVLSNVISAFKTPDGEGGMIPTKVADHHVEVCDSTLKSAFEKAQITPKDIGLIAFSQGPGMGHSLKVGAGVARSLSLVLNKPLVGVNHCIAHLEVGRFLAKENLDGAGTSYAPLVVDDPVLLYASGANTQIIAYEAGKYRVFGETLDVGIGNFLDTFARQLGLGFPGGPKIEMLAKNGKNLIPLPYSVKGMDISLAGIHTKLQELIDSGTHSHEDLCFSVQEYTFAMLVEVAERAMAHTGKDQLVLGGGVACNKRLQEMSRLMCAERGAKCYFLENQFYIDNAAMIAVAGLEMFRSGRQIDVTNSEIRPAERTDDVVVSWRN